MTIINEMKRKPGGECEPRSFLVFSFCSFREKTKQKRRQLCFVCKYECEQSRMSQLFFPFLASCCEMRLGGGGRGSFWWWAGRELSFSDGFSSRLCETFRCGSDTCYTMVAYNICNSNMPVKCFYWTQTVCVFFHSGASVTELTCRILFLWYCSRWLNKYGCLLAKYASALLPS